MPWFSSAAGCGINSPIHQVEVAGHPPPPALSLSFAPLCRCQDSLWQRFDTEPFVTLTYFNQVRRSFQKRGAEPGGWIRWAPCLVPQLGWREWNGRSIFSVKNGINACACVFWSYFYHHRGDGENGWLSQTSIKTKPERKVTTCKSVDLEFLRITL